MPTGTYPIATLARETGVTERTLRHWILQKVLPKPIGRGRGARYDDRHLLRAKVIALLRSTEPSLDKIRMRIARLSDEQLKALLPRPRPPTVDGVPVPPAAPSYPAETWESVELMPGLVLLVNVGKGPVLRRIADQIYQHYALPAG